MFYSILQYGTSIVNEEFFKKFLHPTRDLDPGTLDQECSLGHSHPTKKFHQNPFVTWCDTLQKVLVYALFANGVKIPRK